MAQNFAQRLYSNIPLVVDTMENEAELAFSAWPERLFIIDGENRLAFIGDLGPDGYLPEKVGDWLAAHCP